MFPRSPLTLLVRPKAPFLVPHLLRAPIPVALLSTPCLTPTTPRDVQRHSYATKAHGPRKKKERGTSNPLVGKDADKRVAFNRKVQSSPLDQFRATCTARTISAMMDLYPTAVASKQLLRNDSRRIAQALHTCIRHSHLFQVNVPDLFPFVQQLSSDIRQGVLPSHPYTNVHLLGIYKECNKFDEGYQFWQWLLQNDDAHVDQAVYGAAIELMAYGGMATLEDLENLYQDGLARFPGTFAAYHLSPDAIVPDRTQPTTFVGLPIALLQGILTARILSRDWKNAYLALDTGLRLYPTQLPFRFFELFMTERPISEAYTVYLMACRAGIVVRPHHVTALVTKLKRAMAQRTTLRDRLKILQGISNALYAHLEAGGSLEPLFAGVFLNAFNELLPETAIGQDYEGDAAKIRNATITHAHEFASTLLQAGMTPNSHIFVALMNLASGLKVPNLLVSVVEDMEKSQMDIGEIGRRTVVTSAGILQNTELLERYWLQIATNAEAQGKQIQYNDWITLAKACRRSDRASFFKEQTMARAHQISATIEQTCFAELGRPEPLQTDKSVSLMDIEAFLSEMDKVRGQVTNIAAVTMAGQPLDLRKTPFYMTINPGRHEIAQEATLRAVYDEVTMDPHQPPPPPPAESKTPLSSTGIPLGELRFLNWASIVDLMSEAETTEADFSSRLELAIKEGKPLDKTTPLLLDLRSTVCSPRNSREELRDWIKQLRSPGSNCLNFRKVIPTGPRIGYRPVAIDPAKVINEYKPNNTTPAKPSLRYYVSLESDHQAPRVKHRPFAPRKPLPLNDLSLQSGPEEEAPPADGSSSTTSS